MSSLSAAPAAPPRPIGTWLFLVAVAALVVASFATLDLDFAALFAPGALQKMTEFLPGFTPPDVSPAFLHKVTIGAAETLAMSAIGSVIAMALGVLLALPASLRTSTSGAAPRSRTVTVLVRQSSRLLLNVLRSIPELVWAVLLVIAVGLGPFPGTLALAIHTAGVLGRLFADALENLPAGPAQALRNNGAGSVQTFLYARLPQALPQFLSYTLYRWENNIRAAAVLGVVGAGGLGQLLYFHLSLFHFRQVATVLIAMFALVGLVDALSYWARARLTR